MKKKITQKMLALMFALMTAFSVLPSSIYAASVENETGTAVEAEAETETAEDETAVETETETESEMAADEPETEAETETETEAETETESQVKSVTSVTETYFTDITEYAKAIKSAIKNHEETLEVYFVVQNTDESSSFGNDGYDLAIAHTGNGTEGDYLYSIVKNPRYLTKIYGEFEEGYLIEHIWLFDYYTTKKQDEYVTSKVNSIISSLSVSGKSDYQKIRAIQDYITEHFSQADTGGNYSDRCSAYVLLKNKKGNCKAFASLFYRLCLAAGLDARYVSGGSHAWNIVKVDGTYYCMDAMWNTVAENYFLKGTTEFMTNHSAAKSSCFYDYNVSSSDYVPASSAKKTSSDSSNENSDSSDASNTAETEDTEESNGAETDDEDSEIDAVSIRKLHEAYMDIAIAQRLQLIKYGKIRAERIMELIENTDYILLSPFPSGAASANKLITEKFQITNKELI